MNWRKTLRRSLKEKPISPSSGLGAVTDFITNCLSKEVKYQSKVTNSRGIGAHYPTLDLKLTRCTHNSTHDIPSYVARFRLN